MAISRILVYCSVYVRGMKFCCVILGLLISAAVWAVAQPWTTVGPDGGDVRSLAFDPHNPERVFLGTSAGRLYLSVDSGAHWSRLSRPGAAATLALDHIVIDPRNSNTIYVAAWSVDSPGEGDVFRSRDAGHTWETLPGIHGKSVRALALAPSHPETLIAGALDGIFRSPDGGDHWERISPEGHAEIRNVESIAIDPKNPAVIYAGTWHLPWKTEDGGKSWHSIKTGVIDDSDVFSIVIDPATPSTLYISACSGIYQSTSGGESFRKIHGIPYSARRTRALLLDPHQPGVLFAGTTEGLWRSPDSGATWKRMTSANIIVNAVLVDPRRPSHVLLATDRAGVLASDDGGATFALSNRGFSHRQIGALLVDHRDSSVFYAGVLNDKEYGGVFVSYDAGENWSQISVGLEGRDVFVLRQTDSGALLAGTNRGIFQLKPGDEQWQPLNKLLTGKEAATSIPAPAAPELNASVSALELTPEQWYAATSVGLLISSDNGQSWRKSSLPVMKGDGGLGAAGRFVVVSGSGSVFASADGGETWVAPSIPSFIYRIHSVSVDDKGVLWIASREGAFRSVDQGDSWRQVSALPLADVASIQFDPDNHRVLATGSDSTQVFESFNNGRSWHALESGWLVHELRPVGAKLAAATLFDGIIIQPSPPAADRALKSSPAGNR